MNHIARPFRRLARQQGQALVYGIFVLMGALAASFYVFNTGQISAEKTKLINTADAVAYSAGVMHARALNFSAYTNRALIANETTIAQMVSVASWLEYSADHASRVGPLLCTSYYTVPGWHGTPIYALECAGLTYAASYIQTVNNSGQMIVQAIAGAAEFNKGLLKVAQVTMFAGFLPARHKVLEEVANANYRGDRGAVKVDTIPLTDNFSLFDGKPFLSYRTENERARMAEVVENAAHRDDFVRNRDWDEHSVLNCPWLSPIRGHAQRRGGTNLSSDFNSWRAHDEAQYNIDRRRIRPFSITCKRAFTYDLGDATKTAGSGADIQYTGVPQFLELSDEALGYKPSNPDAHKRDARLRFAIRLTRDRTAQNTSAGTSPVKPTGRLDLWAGQQLGDTMAAVATSEVYFERTGPNVGYTELASLFNPYWQVHLVTNTEADVLKAIAAQGVF